MKRGGAGNQRGGRKGSPNSPHRGGSTPSKSADVHNKSASTASDGQPEDIKRTAAQHFSCPKSQLSHFTEQADPFNPGNVLEGFQCRQDGPYFGSLFLTAVNGVTLQEPQVIYGTPKIEALPPRPPTSPAPVSFYLGNKWNGLNVLFFKYQDAAGKTFVTCKTRGYVFARDYPGGKVFSHPLKIMGIDPEKAAVATAPVITLDALPDALAPLKEEDVQSISFELCGNEEPSLVKYSFDLALKPLFKTTRKGAITPIIAADAAKQITAPKADASYEDRLAHWQADVGPLPFGSKSEGRSQSDLAFYIGEFKNDALKLNEEFRTQNKLNLAYYFQTFAIEGKVIYLLDENGVALSREHIFKLKPSDIELSHAPMFDYAIQAKTIEALGKLNSRAIEVSEDSLKSELGFTEREWNRFGKDIMELVQGIPNTFSPNFKASDQVMIMLVGVPGSGKSTFAKRLLEATGDIYVRVNQDEMGTRHACEGIARNALKKGYSVIVDRVNFDIKQRNNWIKLASEFHVNNIRCLFLDVPLEVAKERILAREDHPTIPKGTTGPAIIDKFSKWQINPTTAEGFCEVVRVSTQEEIDAAFEKFKTLIEPEVLEEGWSSGQGRSKGRGPALKKSAQIADDADDDEVKGLNVSGSRYKSPKPIGREGKAPDVIAYNPYDMLEGVDDEDE